MARSASALINADVLVWARKSAAMELEDAAHKLQVSEERLSSWEGGSAHPTVKQLRKAANLYKRPFSAFYLPKAPKVFRPPVRDYRRTHAESYGTASPELSLDVRLSLDRREILLELMSESGEKPPEFSAKTTRRRNPELVAEEVRELLAVSFDEQYSWTEPRLAFNKWREAIEATGVLVFQTSRVPLSYMRGYSVSELPLPVVVVNRKDSYNGRIFTMLHELAHLLLRGSGVCDLDVRPDRPPREQETEVFCNQVSGAALVPEEELLSNHIVRSNRSSRWDLADIKQLADEFSVSREVILRRLLTFERTSQTFYEEMRRLLQKQYEKSRPKGKGGPTPPVNAVSIAGKPFARTVIDAFYSERITSSEVSDYLGIKLNHLEKVEKMVGV